MYRPRSRCVPCGQRLSCNAERSYITLSLSGAILAVSLFGEQYPVELGRFERALYTMFKVVAGETAFPEAPLLVRTFSASLIL
jgi:hypothetical protein